MTPLIPRLYIKRRTYIGDNKKLQKPYHVWEINVKNLDIPTEKNGYKPFTIEHKGTQQEAVQYFKRRLARYGYKTIIFRMARNY